MRLAFSSPSALRSLDTAFAITFSTVTRSPQRRFEIVSFVTTSPGDASSSDSSCKGLCWASTASPPTRNSNRAESNSAVPKR